MSTFTSLSIPTRFNHSLDALQYGDTSSHKLVVLMPGFLDTKDYTHLKKLGESLADQGFLVISFDPLGTWKSVAPVEMYTMGNWLIEVESVIAWAKKNYSSIQKIALVGHSMGGTISLLYAAFHHEVSAAISIFGGLPFIRPETYETRMVKWKADGMKISRRDDPSDPVKTQRIELPFSFVEDSLKYEVKPVINKIHCPVLLLAAEKDNLVSVKEIDDLYQDFLAGQADFKILPEMGHDYRKNEQFINQVNSEVISFMQKNV